MQVKPHRKVLATGLPPVVRKAIVDPHNLEVGGGVNRAARGGRGVPCLAHRAGQGQTVITVDQEREPGGGGGELDLVGVAVPLQVAHELV